MRETDHTPSPLLDYLLKKQSFVFLGSLQDIFTRRIDKRLKDTTCNNDQAESGGKRSGFHFTIPGDMSHDGAKR